MRTRILLFATLFLSIIQSSSAKDADTGSPARVNTIFAGYNRYTLRPAAGADFTLNGFTVGYDIDFRILANRPLYVGTGIDGRFTFGTKRFHESPTYNPVSAKVSVKFMNFNIPVNVSYRLPVTPLFSVTPQLGLDFRVQAYGNARTDVSIPAGQPDRLVRATGFTPGSVNLFSRNSLGDMALRRFQLGWHAGLKLRYDQFVLGISYGTDFAKLRNELGTSNLLVNLGYMF